MLSSVDSIMLYQTRVFGVILKQLEAYMDIISPPSAEMFDFTSWSHDDSRAS